MLNRMIQRGDIYYASLNPVIGSEQNGIRPVLIVSNNIGNEAGTTVIIVPITSKPKNKHHIPTHVNVNLWHKTGRPSVVLAEQIRTIDKSRLKDFVGVMPEPEMESINEALAISIDLKG